MATARIRLHHLQHNLQQLKALCPRSKILAVVKADAYSHGSVEIVKFLGESQAYYAVSRLKEALALRDVSDAKVVILSELFDESLLSSCLNNQFDLLIHNEETADFIANYSAPENQRICCWLKVDTGMHRLGISPDKAEQIISRLSQADICKDIILTSHLASADEEKPSYNAQQARFEKLANAFSYEASFANSAAIIRSESNHYQWVRPGLAMYGLNPCKTSSQLPVSLKPVMQLVAPVIATRRINKGETVGYGDTWEAPSDCNIITIAAGYADGYPRIVDSNARISINGKRYPLAGRVSMDMITVNVGDDDIVIGAEAELWGDTVSVADTAESAATLSYELLCNLSQRVDRVYISA